MNTNTPVTKRGRKRFPVKFPKGAFTVNDLFALNKAVSPKFCELTARNHITRNLADGKLVKLKDKLKTGTVGAPALKYQLKAAYEYNLNRRAKKAVKPLVDASFKDNGRLDTATVGDNLRAMLS
jgi:hypothetical protein